MPKQHARELMSEQTSGQQSGNRTAACQYTELRWRTLWYVCSSKVISRQIRSTLLAQGCLLGRVSAAGLQKTFAAGASHSCSTILMLVPWLVVMVDIEQLSTPGRTYPSAFQAWTRRVLMSTKPCYFVCRLAVFTRKQANFHIWDYAGSLARSILKIHRSRFSKCTSLPSCPGNFASVGTHATGLDSPEYELYM